MDSKFNISNINKKEFEEKEEKEEKEQEQIENQRKEDINNILIARFQDAILRNFMISNYPELKNKFE